MIVEPARRLSPVVRVAPAKVNLTLAVVGRRDDGFHDLHSVIAPTGLVDRLSVALSGIAADTRHVIGADVVPVEEDLAMRAIAAARAAVRGSWSGAPSPPPGLAVRLEKRIPAAAGLGGGSADAAAALEAALEAWAVDLPADELVRIAASLGSDVPFFLARGMALVEGRGELVTPIGPLAGDPIGLLLVTPAIPVPTPAVFAAYDAGSRPEDGGAATRATSTHLVEEIGRDMASSGLLGRAGILATANDLIPGAEAVAPGLSAFRRRLGRVLHRPVGQSGSGPTLWALYPSQSDAEAGAESVRAALAAGELVAPGDDPPFVTATTLETGGSDR